MRVGTSRPFQVIVLVPGSSVTSARNGLPSTVPSCRDWVTWEIGNSGLVISPGRENTGVPRSTRRHSGARDRHPVPCSFFTHPVAAPPAGDEAGAEAEGDLGVWVAPQAATARTRTTPTPSRAAGRLGAMSVALPGRVLVGFLADNL